MARTQVDHYIPLFGRDFLTATSGWTAEERGHYITLLIVQWEQGSVPAGIDRLELVSPGIAAAWGVLEPEFPLCSDGVRRNPRLGEHRAKCQELKEKRAESGRRGGRPKANGKQNESKPKANCEAKQKPPTPTPTSSLREEIHTHAETDAGDFRQAGWAAEEWDRFVSVWNATARAAKWTPLMAPSDWVDHAASPGWLERARQAMARLPQCLFFENPLAVTKFFQFVDRILAGEFDNAKKHRGVATPDEKPPPKVWKDNYQPAPYRTPKEVAALATGLKLKEEDL